MSVYASKRKKSNVQFLDTAMDLWRYSRAKALKFPKRRTFYGGARINELAAHCCNYVVVPFIRLLRTVGGMWRLQRAWSGLQMTIMAPLVMFGCAPRMSTPPTSSVWSTHLGARTMTMPITRMAWRWDSILCPTY